MNMKRLYINEQIDNEEQETPNQQTLLKIKLLYKYLNRPVTAFRQYDFYTNYQTNAMMNTIMNAIFHPDEDGDCLYGGETLELMDGANVRVLISPDTLRKDAVRALLKIADSVNTDNSYDENTGDNFDIDDF